MQSTSYSSRVRWLSSNTNMTTVGLPQLQRQSYMRKVSNQRLAMNAVSPNIPRQPRARLNGIFQIRDYASRDRDRRMFSMLRHTLQSNSQQTTQLLKERQRTAAEQRAEAKAVSVYSNRGSTLLSRIRRRRSKLSRRLRAMRRRMHALRERKKAAEKRLLMPFIRTQAKPYIFYLPKIPLEDESHSPSVTGGKKSSDEKQITDGKAMEGSVKRGKKLAVTQSSDVTCNDNKMMTPLDRQDHVPAERKSQISGKNSKSTSASNGIRSFVNQSLTSKQTVDRACQTDPVTAAKGDIVNDSKTKNKTRRHRDRSCNDEYVIVLVVIPNQE